MTARLRLGTRGSPLARRQADLAIDALRAVDPEFGVAGAVEVVVIRTTGDQVTDRPLAEIGGKGLFCKEIETALLERRIDIAVHSLKDLPTWLPDGLMIGAVLNRADPRDVLIARVGAGLADLPAGALVGTTSPRRQAQVLARRPDLRIAPLRGNVGTRLQKIEAGVVDATLLAQAGLERLGVEVQGCPLAPEEFLPACGQGVIALECRAADGAIRDLLDRLDHPPSALATRAERALLEALDGSCHTPIGGLAEFEAGGLRLRALLAWPDGSACIRTERVGSPADAARLGRDAGHELRTRAGPHYPGF
jgi:hydroxymethylbilane synthase